MGWGALTGAQQILVLLNVRGGAASAAQIRTVGKQAGLTGAQINMMGGAMATTTRRSFLMNQALFSLRRGLFYVTLAIGVGIAAILKMGFSYDSAMNQASVALQPVIKGQGALNKELNQLFKIAALTPFTFQDITTSFRTMYAGFQPLGISLKTTNDTIQGIADILSYTGKTGTGAFNRVALALQHLANLGKPTGQIFQQLGRDGIPVAAVLRKEFGMTREEFVASGASAMDFFNAIIRYSKTAPGVMNAALRQSNRTLSGAVSTFKDLVSQASGRALGGTGGGLFGGLRTVFAGVNKQLATFYNGKKPLTFLVIAEAFDKQLSPKTHIVLDLFYLFDSLIKGFIGTLLILAKTVGTVFGPFIQFTTVLDSNVKLVKVLGYWLGIAAGIFVAYKIAVVAAEIATLAYRAILLPLVGIEKLVVFWTNAMAIANAGLTSKAPLMIRFVIGLTAVLGEMAAGFTLAGGGARGLAVALRILVTSIPVIGWVIGLTALVVLLYEKWGAFHKVVDQSLRPLKDTVHQLSLMYNVIQRIVPLLPALNSAKKKDSGGGFNPRKYVKDVLNTEHLLLPQFQPIHFATGGIMSYGGMASVGERGPENVYLPAGARVVPQTVSPVGSTSELSGNTQPIVVQVMLDRKVLAEGVARANQDKRARR